MVRCVDSRCSVQNKDVVVQIVDKCPECKHGDLDFSFPAYKVHSPLLCELLAGCACCWEASARQMPPPLSCLSLPPVGYYRFVAKPADRAVAVDRVSPHRRHHPPHPQGRLQPQLAGVLLWQLKASRKEGPCMHAGGRKGGWDCPAMLCLKPRGGPPSLHPPHTPPDPRSCRYPLKRVSLNGMELARSEFQFFQHPAPLSGPAKVCKKGVPGVFLPMPICFCRVRCPPALGLHRLERV